MQVAAVRLGDEAWGPGSLRFTLDDVDGHALRRLHRAALRVQSQPEGGDPGQTAVAAVDVLEALPQLLARGPRLALQHLQLATPAGPVSAHGQATLVARDPAAGPLSLWSFVQAGVEAQLPASILVAVVDAKARSEVATEGAEAPGGGDFDSKVRERRDAHQAALRSRAGLVKDGGTARLAFSLAAGTAGASDAAEAPAPTPAPASGQPASAATAPAEVPVAEAPTAPAKPGAEAAAKPAADAPAAGPKAAAAPEAVTKPADAPAETAKPADATKPADAAPGGSPAPKEPADLAQQPAAGSEPEERGEAEPPAGTPAQPPAAPASEPAPARAQ
jgi:hypothetical protein